MSSNWRLEAISNAALKRKRTSFVLRVGENKVGKKKDCLVKIPSLLCSREHCSIFLDDEKVFVDDTSRNGTYITFSGNIGTKQYLNSSTEQPLENNDIISFGFNTASVYDINDKNAFIYRLVKESIETIDLMLSDDDDTAASTAEKERPAAPVATLPPATQDRIISIENKIINIDSDSNSQYSGDECLQNIEEMDGQSSSLSSVGSSLESEDNSTSNLSEDSVDDYDEDDDDDDDANFVVTKTFLNCDTPTETISLIDESDDDNNANDNNAKVTKVPANSEPNNQKEVLDSTASTSKADTEKEKIKDENKEEGTTNGDLVTSTSEFTSTAEKPSASAVADQAKNDKTPSETDKPEATDKPKTANADDDQKLLAERLNAVKRRMAVNVPRQINMTKAQPLRKRRRTLTESEYLQHKVQKQKKKFTSEDKQLRREKLADVEKKKAAAAAATTDATERTPFVPKVKIVTVSRGEQLLTDMLALNPTNI